MVQRIVRKSNVNESYMYQEFEKLIGRKGTIGVIMLLLHNEHGLTPKVIREHGNLKRSQTFRTLSILKDTGLVNSLGHNYHITIPQKTMLQRILNLAIEICLFKVNHK